MQITRLLADIRNQERFACCRHLAANCVLPKPQMQGSAVSAVRLVLVDAGRGRQDDDILFNEANVDVVIWKVV